ncbi:MAG TPA: GNAT family N-acetyltransferase [Pyrinomonadaceae bacterium]|nr:GNAT family N-acetyltransferase [Pyrinomonadaceae bacterium]
MNEVRLETERLVLRWFREDDLDDFCRMSRDPEVMRFLGDGKPMDTMFTWRQMATFMGHWYFRGYGIWAVEEKSSGRVVGRIGFMNPVGWPAFELGWTLARDSWGKGYATEGARRALEYAFTEMNRDHVISLIAPDNVASIRVAERLGERVEGETTVMDREVLICGIDREQWLATRQTSTH